jgi:CheY-like chemotaxis protein
MQVLLIPEWVKGRARMPKILLAEDNPADVYLIRAALEEHSIDVPVQVASDGREVLELMADSESRDEPQFSLIILDLNLPRHDGIEILQEILERKRWTSVPVIVLTSSDSPRDRALASQLGATRFLRKPSNLEQFLNLGLAFKEVMGFANTEKGGA